MKQMITGFNFQFLKIMTERYPVVSGFKGWGNFCNRMVDFLIVLLEPYVQRKNLSITHFFKRKNVIYNTFSKEKMY